MYARTHTRTNTYTGMSYKMNHSIVINAITVVIVILSSPTKQLNSFLSTYLHTREVVSIASPSSAKMVVVRVCQIV